MKKKLNFWILNIFLTVVAAFLLSGGVFAEPTDDLFRSKGSRGIIKLSGKNPITFAEGKTLSVRSTLHKHFE